MESLEDIIFDTMPKDWTMTSPTGTVLSAQAVALVALRQIQTIADSGSDTPLLDMARISTAAAMAIAMLDPNPED